MKELYYYYWISSDWAYFGNPRLRAIQERFGMRIHHRPVDLVTVYARTGGIQLQLRSDERKAYRLTEMRRFSELLDMPIVLEPKSPPVTGHLPACAVIAAQALGLDVHDFSHALMTALWVQDRDIEDEQVVADVVDQCGLDVDTILNAAKLPLALDAHQAFTEEAIAKGVFGAPFYIYGDEPFWGQDRLAFLSRAIEGRTTAPELKFTDSQL